MAVESFARGTVSSIDLSEMEVDGDARLWIASDDGKRVSIRVPTGFAPPSPASLDVLTSLKPGDRGEVLGSLDAAGGLGLAESGHYLKKLNR